MDVLPVCRWLFSLNLKRYYHLHQKIIFLGMRYSTLSHRHYCLFYNYLMFHKYIYLKRTYPAIHGPIIIKKRFFFSKCKFIIIIYLSTFFLLLSQIAKRLSRSCNTISNRRSVKLPSPYINPAK